MARSAIGEQAANDGSQSATPYTPGTEAGAWRPTGNGCTVAFAPHWGLVWPLALTSGSQFRLPRPGGFATYAQLPRQPALRTEPQ